MEAAKIPPIFNIFQVTGNVGVPKRVPISDNPTNINTNPTNTIDTKAQLVTIYLKSIFDNFQVVFKF